MTDRGREGGDGALWSLLVTALQEYESEARTALLNEVMKTTFDVHCSRGKKKRQGETPPLLSHTHSSSVARRVNHSHVFPQNHKTRRSELDCMTLINLQNRAKTTVNMLTGKAHGFLNHNNKSERHQLNTWMWFNWDIYRPDFEWMTSLQERTSARQALNKPC